MIFESHAHYDDEAFNQDRNEVLEKMQNQGISHIINVCASVESLESTKALMEQYSFIYGAFGIHPDEVGNLDQKVMKKIEVYGSLSKALAIGEIGLDYYWDKENHKLQMESFERQMDLAKRLKKPIIVHSREAAADTLQVMKSANAKNIGGVIHCFSYGKEMAKEYLDMGFYLGIGGIVTFQNAKKLKEVVAYAPLDQLLLETDSPYLSPVPNRGKRNQSSNLEYVAEVIGVLKGCETKEIISRTADNGKRLFGIK